MTRTLRRRVRRGERVRVELRFFIDEINSSQKFLPPTILGVFASPLFPPLVPTLRPHVNDINFDGQENELFSMSAFTSTPISLTFLLLVAGVITFLTLSKNPPTSSGLKNGLNLFALISFFLFNHFRIERFIILDA